MYHDQITLSIIVVTYKTRELLSLFLKSAYRELEELEVKNQIIVVDNASHDGTVEMLAREFPEVNLIENPANEGPAYAYNRGLEAAVCSSKYIILANSDVEVIPGTLQKMYVFMESHPGVDGCSGPLHSPEGLPPQHTRTFIHRILPVPKTEEYRETFPGNGFSMYRSRAFLKIGGFDEFYYFFNEDLDWVTRASREDLVFYHLRYAPVYHLGAGGRSQNKRKIRRELPRSDLYYFRRYYLWLAYPVYLYNRHSLRKKEKQGVEEAAKALELLEKEWREPSRPEIPWFEQDFE